MRARGQGRSDNSVRAAIVALSLCGVRSHPGSGPQSSPEPAEPAMPTLCRLVVLIVLGGVLVALVQADDAVDDPNRFQRLSAYLKSYVTKKGINEMYSERDVRCLLSVGRALRQQSSSNKLVQPVGTAFNVIMNTSPSCKLSLLAKSRMFLYPEFFTGLVAILLNKDVTASTAGVADAQ